MKNSTEIAIALLSLAAIPFLSGCGSSTEQVKETSSTTYIPSPPQRVVVQPAPVVTLPPTTVTTNEEKSASNSTESGNNATEESSSAYHSESSTVTPMATIPVAPQAETRTTYQKKTYQETN